MEWLIQLVQRVTIFLLISTVFIDLFSGTEYQKYIRYAVGLMVIVMVAAPILQGKFRIPVREGSLQWERWEKEWEKKVMEQQDKIEQIEQEYESELYADRQEQEGGDLSGR